MIVSLLLAAACSQGQQVLWRVPNSVLCEWFGEFAGSASEPERRWFCGDGECDDMADVVAFRDNQISEAERAHGCHSAPYMDSRPPGAESGCPDAFDVDQEYRECWVRPEDWPEGIDSGG